MIRSNECVINIGFPFLPKIFNMFSGVTSFRFSNSTSFRYR